MSTTDKIDTAPPSPSQKKPEKSRVEADDPLFRRRERLPLEEHAQPQAIAGPPTRDGDCNCVQGVYILRGITDGKARSTYREHGSHVSHPSQLTPGSRFSAQDSCC